MEFSNDGVSTDAQRPEAIPSSHYRYQTLRFFLPLNVLGYEDLKEGWVG